MEGIALIRRQIGRLDSVCFLMRHQTLACFPPPLPLYQGEAFPSFPLGGFPLFHPWSWHTRIWGKDVSFHLKVFILCL